MKVVLAPLIYLLILQAHRYKFAHFFRTQFFVGKAYAMFDVDYKF